MQTKKAKLTLSESKTLELPILSPTLGNDVIDIAPISKSGYFTFDPGYAVTASCESKITFIDGKNGVLLYRGYPIEQLAKVKDYMDVCYLVYYGELPNEKQKQNYVHAIKDHINISDTVTKIILSFDSKLHPMGMLISALGSIASQFHNEINIHDEANRNLVATQIIAKMPTLAAMCYKRSKGENFIPPEKGLDFIDNFMHMMFGSDKSAPDINPVLSKAMDTIFSLHADHEQNASTSTVRLAGSTGANPFAAIAAGVAALWGPAHGGANEAALKMLKEIGDEKNISKYIEKAKDKNDPFRLMGFGHRVYKNYDPRAKIMRKTAHAVLEELGLHNNPLFKMALKLEKIALEDDYFIEKKLYPNVDFYSGITQQALGIPSNMFTVMFATARTAGWISNWNEMLSNPYRLGRPRQLYTGHKKRDLA